MSDSDFEKKVLLSLDDILNYLTAPDKDAIELRRITSNQETLIQTLESELKKMRIYFLKMKDENEELLSMLKDKQRRIISLENNLRNFNTSCLESADSIETVEQTIKKDKVLEIYEEISEVITSKHPMDETGFELLDSENWNFPEELLEHDGFSLSKLKKEKVEKKEIIHDFKVFILILAYVMHEDDSESFGEFLDFKQADIDGSLRQEAYLKWKAGKGKGEYIDKIYDCLEKIPQKNRYIRLIEKFEKLIS